MHSRKLLFSDILKQNKEKPRCSLYIGLNLHGGSISDLKIEGGESPEDYHVTLVWGLFNPRSDIDDTVCRIQDVMKIVPKLLPRSLAFFHEHRFEASESSDGKDVIVAKVAHHSLDQAHDVALELLKREHINLEMTFPEYVPHMTLAYIEPDAEYELRTFNKVGYIRDITVCIKDNETHEKLYERVYEVARTFSQLMKFNPYHDELGRFTSGGGGYASFSANPNTKAGKLAIERASQNSPLVGLAYGNNKQSETDDNPTETRDKTIDRLKAIADYSNKNTPNEWNYHVQVRDWENYGQSRTYLSIVETRTGSKHRSVKDFGYYDNNKKEYVPKNKTNDLRGKLYDFGGNNVIKKKSCLTFSDIFKFNPYHDRLGRFTSSGAATSFTIRTRSKLSQGAADTAVSRAKEHMASVMPSKAQEKTLNGIERRTRNLKKEQFRVVDRDGNVVMQKQGGKTSVSYSVGEARDNFPGNITIHNHPDGGTFSSADLSDIGYGATEIRAAAPEGTYVLRNINHGSKWVDGQKTWIDMRDDIDAASFDFKSGYKLKQEVKASFTEDNAKITDITNRWQKARDSGASQEELNKYVKEYDEAAAVLKTKVETATRKAYTDQYHDWYKSNAMNYGMEYEFIPARTTARKSYFMDELIENNDSVSKSDDIVLDGKMNEDIAELTDAIMAELLGDSESIMKNYNNDYLPKSSFIIKKADADKRLVFGWALVSATKEGETIIDHQGDIVDQEDLEEGAYEYVLNFRDAGEEHIGTLRKKARMVESVVFTEEKLKAMGIPTGTVPIGWWIGFYVDDDTTWERIKDGTYQMFSIEGKAIREPVNEPVTKIVAKSFMEMIEKFNPYHDAKGRFTTGGNATSFTYKPGASKAHDLAIEREKQKHAATYTAARPKEATPRIKELQRIEDKIRKQNFESAALVDDNGNQIFFKDGQRSQVGFTRRECMQMQNATLTHNHPRCSMFSPEDLNCMTVNGMYEIRATNRDGTTYSMRRADGGYFTQKAMDFVGAYAAEYPKSNKFAQKDLDSRGFADKIWKGEITHEEANMEFGRATAKYMSDWASENAPKYGLVFTVEQRNVSKSFMVEVMKNEKGKGIALDQETNAEMDKAFNEWLASHGLADSSKEERTAKSFSELMKFNPYHDEKGRFTFADGRGGIASFTYRTKDPNKQHWADKAVARQKEREASKKPGSEFGLTPEQHEKLERQLNGSRFSALSDKTRRELGMSDEDFEKYKAKYKSEERRKQIEQEKEAKRKQEEEAKREQQRQFDERIKQELPGLSQDAINHANSASFYEHGTNAAREALSRLDSYRERNQPKDDYTDEQKSYLKQREEEYKQLLTEYYNDSNQRWGDNPGWHVTGPARYNVNRYERKEQAARNKAAEYEEKLKRFEENTNKRIKSMEPEEKQIAYWRNGKFKSGETIDASDPLATKKLQAKLDYQKEAHQKMKDANAYYRKNGTMDGFEGFSERTNQQINSSMQDTRFGRRSQPFPSYSLTNSNQQIKATESRLKQMERTKATASSPGGGGSTFNGGQIIRNTDANRLQIKFDGIPDAATRQQLKSSGWRWSPKNGVWQRQLTDNAERSAKQITDSLNKSYYPATAKSFSEIMDGD